MPLFQAIRNRLLKTAPGSEDFLKSLSIVTVCFVISRIFSSIASIAFNRYLGLTVLGETKAVSLVSQLVTVPMLFGLHTSMMRYGTQKENPAREVATVAYMFGIISLIFAVIFWFARSYFQDWFGISDYKILWAIGSALVLAGFNLFSAILQTLHLFKQRGIMEIIMTALIIPGMIAGHFIFGRHFETQLLAFGLAYAIPIIFMIWRFRHMLSPRWLFSEETASILKYGLLMAVSNIAFLVIFVVQPLQIKQYMGDDGLGLFSVYSIGSLQLATLATSIFFAVFFPKISKSQNKHIVWRLLTKSWIRAGVPVFLFFVIMETVVILLSGKKEYPYDLQWVLWFAAASTLITIHATYSQIITAEGIRGTMWGLILAFVSAAINFWLSGYLIPQMGVPGAVITLSVNYAIILAATIVVGRWLILKQADLPITAA